eukprot:TRINITY_DN44652_c0_g1_i1.p1 TRINITY_DN44652_c0_g1~~TRINITY_DN44652_c0_g1_i1.p1  ORF type:complete len:185 (+),score=60.81 TRINITY_DN44652_c0_g1_i1:48-602(+)
MAMSLSTSSEVDTAALTSLFGSSKGEVSSLFGSSDASTMAGYTQEPVLPLAPDLIAAGDEPKELPVEEAKDAEPVSEAKNAKVVVIDEFDQLADFFNIALAQGLTETDLEGKMTITDASGSSFTWDTFSPAAKFPIKMEFATAKQEFAQGDRAAAGAEKRSRLAAAAKKRAAAAKAKGSSKPRR